MKRYRYSYNNIEEGQSDTQPLSRVSFRKGVVQKGSKGLKSFGRSIKSKVAVAFPEDFDFSREKIFDPQAKYLQVWNRLFLVICFLAVSIDPLLFYVPYIDDYKYCLDIESDIAETITFFRTILDVLYAIRILVQFRTAFIAPSSRVFGRGELVIDPAQIAKRYLKSGIFMVDFLSILPLPQIAIWQYLFQKKNVAETKVALLIIVLVQYIPRFLRIFPLASQLKRTVGVFVQSAFFGAISYLLLFILSSHIVGSFWYLLSLQRTIRCWETACRASPKVCKIDYLYCSTAVNDSPSFKTWRNSSEAFLRNACSPENDGDPTPGAVKFGIYRQALEAGIFKKDEFLPKYLYCLWWGLQNLSTLGQGLQTSLSSGEIGFSLGIAVFGLIIFALLIGNMQTYLQSLTLRVEEMRLKRRDTEQWMHHRALPQNLQDRVRRYDQYRWVETRGVNEQSLVQTLPKDLRRDIKRHLCLALVRRVPLFAKMDERLLDAICERLKPSLYTEMTYIVREGDPVQELLVIMRGQLESATTDGGRTGFYNESNLKSGDFCGDELLTWSLDPKTGSSLPSSTRTVKSLTAVEAFSLSADDMRYVASQFRRLHSRQVQNTFRYYSQKWRTWGACFIQSAWRRHLKRKAMKVLQMIEEDDADVMASSSSSLGASLYVSRFATNALRGIQRIRSTRTASELVQLQKPREPDFNTDDTA
ncbi:hypothetical protein ACHQM5_008783 [Ranunculus cassubicifolius]